MGSQILNKLADPTAAERSVKNPICSVADYQTGLELTLTYEGPDKFILIMKELLQADKVNALPEVQQYAPIVNYCRNSNIIQYAIWIVGSFLHKTDGLILHCCRVDDQGQRAHRAQGCR